MSEGSDAPPAAAAPRPAMIVDLAPIEAVEARMRSALDRRGAGDPLGYFLSTYLRTTRAVREAIRDARFEDPQWVVRWDVVFAELYLDALDRHGRDPATAPRPWRIAFAAPADLHPLGHVLLGINAHINYDLPQALLTVISAEDFGDDHLVARRERDHARIDAVLASRIAAEDAVLEASVGGRTVLDRVLTPMNRLASRRFLREARQKVWINTMALHTARRRGPSSYAVRLAELELLSAARVADLLTPGQVLLRLAVSGFGVVLPPS